ncbi:MAG: hypothetical protein ACP5PB_09140, partial [Acidimicrobiales bacterium]
LWVTAAVLLGGAVLVLHLPLRATLSAAPSVVVTVAALAAAGTLYGALTGGDASATLLPLLSLPAFAPLLIAGERSLSAAVTHQGLWQWWVLDAVALVAYLAVGILLYAVLEET